jgi:diguanylate cyclase (GGDEF)-like protein
MVTSLFTELGLIDCVIFKHIGAHEFEVIYKADSWFDPLIQGVSAGHNIEIDNNCPFLLDFMQDAIPHWQAKAANVIDSGIWIETIQGHPLRLEAQAINNPPHSYLVVHRLKDKFEKKQQTLQLARELLLSNDQITARHEQLEKRMADLLNSSSAIHTLEQPIIQALEQAEIGVAVLDERLQMLKGNPALQALFSDTSVEIKQPIDRLLLELFKKQYPEYERIFATHSPWSGELCWLNPPEQGKWLKVSIYPIKDGLQHIKNWILSVSDVTQVKFLLKRNEKLSHYDVLTDLPNRQYFWQQLEDRALRGKPFFLLYLDIEKFKRVNELHGHATGDQVLIGLAKRLSSLTRMDDLIARIGGAEFAVVLGLDDLNTQHLHNEYNQCKAFIREVINACSLPFYLESGGRCEIQLNIGATSFPKDSKNIEELIKFADIAVSAAKNSPETHTAFYSQKLVEDALKRVQMENALQTAITNNEFELFFQPIINLESGQVIKAEALIRWRKIDGTLVSPTDFIPLAEQTGLIVPIGKWVINQACKQMKVLSEAGKIIKISVNLSPRQIADRQLFSFIKQSLNKHKVNPCQFEIELTEGVLIDDYDKVQHLLSELRTLGISVAIDDFGTGYSSLAYLQKLAIDHIKIDRSFVMSLTAGNQGQDSDSAIVLAVIAMAKSLNVGVIAEGVETDYQKRFLQECNCPSAQGFLFSKPLPIEQFLRLPAQLP